MGLFRSGLLACLVAGLTTFAQDNPAAPGTVPAPGVVPDTNAPAPIVPPTATPEVDPNALQPAPITPDGGAATAPAPAAAKPKPKKPAAPALPTLRGTLGSIDKTNMTVVVHGKSKDETLSITSKTRIFVDKKPGILSDIKEGENVVAEYRNTKEKTKEALTLRLGGASGGIKSDAALAKEEPDAKPAAKKPAAKKSTRKSTVKKPAKKTPATENAAPAPAGDTGVTPLPTPDASVVPPRTTPAPAPAPGTPGANP